MNEQARQNACREGALEPTIYELSVPGRCGADVAKPDVPVASLPKDLLRDDNGLPELSQRIEPAAFRKQSLKIGPRLHVLRRSVRRTGLRQ